MLRRTTRWLAHHVHVPICLNPRPRYEERVQCAWYKAYATECYAFLKDGHIGALCWQTTCRYDVCDYNGDIHSKVAEKLLEMGDIATFDRFRAVHDFIPARFNIVKLIVKLGNTRLLQWWLSFPYNVEQIRMHKGCILALALEYENWEIVSILLPHAASFLIHSLDQEILTRLLRAARRSLAVFDALDLFVWVNLRDRDVDAIPDEKRKLFRQLVAFIYEE
jgi:hypothetical protein